MQFKVCGITTLEQLHALAGMGLRYAGFIFYPPSPRHAERFGLRGPDVRKVRHPFYKVGVFVNPTYEEVISRVEEWGLDMVQLHGHESPWECERILPHVDVIKGFRFVENDHVEWIIRDYAPVTDFFLLDSGVHVAREEREREQALGGTGRCFNWNRLRGVEIRKPYLLSGGIAPGDADNIRAFMQQQPAARDLVAIDINSRFEVTPGIKNLPLIEKFIADINAPLPDPLPSKSILLQ